MGISAGELAAQRRVTEAFINADNATVTLQRSTRTADGEGGYVTSPPTPLPPQVMRLVPLSDGVAVSQRFTADGQAVTPGYALVGRHDADVQRWDTFTLDYRMYEVVFVVQNRQYQTKAEVVYRG